MLPSLQIEKIPSLFGTLSQEMIQDIHKKVDHDNNGTIEYSEFLAHSLTEDHLSEKNVRLFFDVMLPASEHDESPKTRSSSFRSLRTGSLSKKNQRKQFGVSPKKSVDDSLQNFITKN